MLDCQACAESIVRDESALPQDGSGMANPQRPERSWDAREVCPPGLPSQAGPLLQADFRKLSSWGGCHCFEVLQLALGPQRRRLSNTFM